LGVRSDLDVTKPLKLYDVDLIYSDLMSIFNTLPAKRGSRSGQRVEMPDYGSNLRLYLFEQNDMILRDLIKQEVIRVIRLDSRLKVNLVTVNSSNLDVLVTTDIRIVPLGIDRVMNFKFVRG